MKQSHQTLTSLGPIPHEIFFVRLNGEVTAFHAPVRLAIDREALDEAQPPHISGGDLVYALPGGIQWPVRHRSA